MTRSFLYVIGPDDPIARTEWVKIGRSADPSLRRSQLQVGQGTKLKVFGSFEVLASDAPRLEAAVHAALAPLKMKGEVFQAVPALACVFVEHIAQHGKPDEFLALALGRDLAQKEWNRLLDLPSARGRWSNPETVAKLEAAEVEMKIANEAMFSFDFERGCKVDEIMGGIMGPAPAKAPLPPQQKIVEGKRILVPRQPRIGPSLFKRKSNGG